jgi:hypothetical protein
MQILICLDLRYLFGCGVKNARGCRSLLDRVTVAQDRHLAHAVFEIVTRNRVRGVTA